MGSSRNLGGKQGLRRSTKKAARGRSMKARPTQSRKGVKGGLRPFSSAPCRVKGGLRPFSSVPCGVWGNAPTVPRPTNLKEAANKGAGSEASLPVTLRVRRRAPKLLSPPRFHEEPFCELDASVVEKIHRHVSAAEGHPHADFRLLRLHNLCAGAR